MYLSQIVLGFIDIQTFASDIYVRKLYTFICTIFILNTLGIKLLNSWNDLLD